MTADEALEIVNLNQWRNLPGKDVVVCVVLAEEVERLRKGYKYQRTLADDADFVVGHLGQACTEAAKIYNQAKSYSELGDAMELIIKAMRTVGLEK